jgi:hypothetical protein
MILSFMAISIGGGCLRMKLKEQKIILDLLKLSGEIKKL